MLAVRWFGEHELRRMVQQSGFALIEQVPRGCLSVGSRVAHAGRIDRPRLARRAQAPYSWLDSKDAMSQYVIAARGSCARGTNSELPADPRVGDIEPTVV